VCPSLPATTRPELVDVTCECARALAYCKLWQDELELQRRTAVIDASVSLRAYSPWVPDSQTNQWRYIPTAERKCQVQPHPLFFHENINVLVPWARGAVPSGRATPMRECRRPPFLIHHIACAAALRPWHWYLRIPTSASPPPGHSLDVALSVSDRAFCHVPALLYVFLHPPSLPRIPQSRALCALLSSHHYLCHYFPLAWNHVRFMG
jgi:hypothetical protein